MMADADRLQQVMWNLLSNAVRFTPPGGGITVSGERLGSTIRLLVKDTGAGIPSAHLPFVFDRFRQVDSSVTRTHRGLGLGLAIVRYIVEAHGGTVGAESEGEGRGTTFTVLLPVRAVDTSELATSMPAKREGEELSAGALPIPPAALAGVRVLVVEDEADSLELIREVLERAGASVIAATSARRALETRGSYDIMVSDIGLPEMDGYSLIRQIRSRKVGGEVPALALTAYARAEDAARAMRAGYQEHLTKPIDARLLVDAIRRWCRRDGERPPSGARLCARGA
jgi:CheY-like chemotaxis protein